MGASPCLLMGKYQKRCIGMDAALPGFYSMRVIFASYCGMRVISKNLGGITDVCRYIIYLLSE
jgi:hypothetical protein